MPKGDGSPATIIMNIENWKYAEHNDFIIGLIEDGLSSGKIAQRLIKVYDLPDNIESLSRTIRVFKNAYQGKSENVQKDHYIESVPLNFFIDREQKSVENNNDVEINSDGSGQITYKGMKNITSKDEAYEFFEIDRNEFIIDRLKFGTHSVTMKLKEFEIKRLNEKDKILYFQKPIQIVNYTCKVELKPREKTNEEKYNEVLQYIKDETKPFKLKGKKGKGESIIAISDCHFGLITQSNNPDTLFDRFKRIAATINEKGEDVHLFVLGDLLESGAGALMHESQMFETRLDLTGISGIRAFYEAFVKFLLNNIEVKVKSINICSGNHDRTAKRKNEASPFSSVAEVFYYFLKDNVKGVDIEYDYSVVTRTVDGIRYIGTHGDSGASKKLSEMVHDYGDQNANYTVLITGHLHSRKTKKTISSKAVQYGNNIVISEQHLKFRHIQLPALCTANSYATNLGYSSGCGFAIIKKSMHTPSNVDHLDLALD